MTVHSQDHFEGPYKHCEELKEQLSAVASFCKLAECVDMPEQTYITRTLSMTPEIAGCYRSMKKEQQVVYNDHLATALTKLAAATRLQQISSGFIYGRDLSAEDEEDIMPDEVTWIGGTNPKMEAVKRDVDESDKPVIILTRYTAEASRLYDEFKDKYSTLLYTGWKKTGTIDEFKAGKYDVLIANTACIARGFNLQNSHTVIFYSNTFSMELRQQAEFRTYRIGQKEVCKYVDYMYEGTIDEDIVRALQMKKNMLEYFREQE
jgi:SNF2 family DNA or RNA helicase